MNIGIIGLGFVGDAMDNGLQHFGWNNIKRYDPFKLKDSKIEDVIDCEICFICVPTPMKTGGSIDDTIVNDVLQKLSDSQYEGIAVIKSTLSPVSVRKFINQYKNLRIATNPEFLTERRAREDFINTEWILIGSDDINDSKIVRGFYITIYGNKNITYFETTPEAVMMAKYMTNIFFAVKVTLMNEFFELWSSLNDHNYVKGAWEEVVCAFACDNRVGREHLQVPGPDGQKGWGGKCYPKDLNALMSLSKQIGISHRVMKAAWDDNKEYRANKDWLTIDGAVTEDYEEE